MMWLFIKGGPVMIPILIGSILGLAIIIEKCWMFITIRLDVQRFTASILMLVRDGKFQAAIDLCSRTVQHPVVVVMKAGLERRTLTTPDLERVLERIGNSQVKHLEQYIGGLISIIGIEPLLGFLGTITGLIRAFMSWEKAGANVTVSLLASGIYEAMITTATGLAIAVPYYLVCNFFVSRIKYISYEISDSSMQLVETLAATKQTAAKA